jgi:GTP-binding protein
MRFLDEVKIYLKAGDGGNGSASFRREKFIPHGGPDGGNGGVGGSVVFKADAGLNTLIDYRYKQHFKIKPGESGRGQNRNGKATEDMILKVPVGTQVYAEDAETLLADLVVDKEEITIAHGGKGGLGNSCFKSSTNRSPREFTKGMPGEEMWVWLRLKLLADVGIIGLPNAGKSTLLSVVSRAKPKIADYPFTTLIPQLGVVRAGEDSFVMADIPGLIKGASEGTGLGDRFLKHIERCKMLVHLIDISAEDLYESYATIRHELAAYSNILADKQEIVVLNKTDLLPGEEVMKLQLQLSAHIKKPVFTISAATKTSITELTYKINDLIRSG